MTYEYFKENFSKLTKREKSFHPYLTKYNEEKTLQEIQEIKEFVEKKKEEILHCIEVQKILQN